MYNSNMLVGLIVQLLALQTTQPADAQARAQAYLEARHVAGGFPAANAAIAWPSGKVWTFSVGKVAEDGDRPLKPTDRMLSGSIGKSYYAVEFVQEWRRRNWSLDDPISKWVGEESWYKFLPNAEKLTPRLLLNHGACLPEYFGIPSAVKMLEEDPLRVWTIEDRLMHLKDQKSMGEPGKDWSYADTHYIVLGGIYEKATGKNFTKQVMELLTILSMRGTVPSDKVAVPGLIAGFSKPLAPFTMKGAMVEDGKMRMNPQFEWTGGGFANTAEALAQWTARLHGGKSIPKVDMLQIQDGIACTLGRDQKYGLGCQIRPSKHGSSFGHSGWFPGYLSDSAYFPERGFAVAIQFNTDDMALLKGSPYGYLIGLADSITQPIPSRVSRSVQFSR